MRIAASSSLHFPNGHPSCRSTITSTFARIRHPICSWRVCRPNGINKLTSLPTFRILVFRSDRLERWSEIEAVSAVEAIQLAAQKEREGIVELWSDEGKLATLRPVGRHN